jgi:hypothetical protein
VMGDLEAYMQQGVAITPYGFKQCGNSMHKEVG